MTENQQEALENRIFFFPRQKVAVQDFPADGFILDVGGGGEGIIGILKGERVVAIDLHKCELEAAGPGPLKIVMDAADLHFLDATFSTATAFFSLMYIRESGALEKVFGEVFRVLKPGADFLIWDVMIPKRMDKSKDIYAVRLSVQVAGREVCTGYGQPWPRQKRNRAFFLELAKKAGFRVLEQKACGRVFFMKLQKP